MCNIPLFWGSHYRHPNRHLYMKNAKENIEGGALFRLCCTATFVQRNVDIVTLIKPAVLVQDNGKGARLISNP